jgi:hypothetical protein
MSLRIGVLDASRIAELAVVGPTHDLGWPISTPLTARAGMAAR